MPLPRPSKTAVGLLAFTGAAAAGIGMGWLAERRLVAPAEVTQDPEWRELRRPIEGRAVDVEAFDGTMLHAQVFDTRGAAPPVTVVLAHGYGMSQHVWHYQRRDLRGRVRLVSYDQRGHGRSEEASSGDYSIHALGRDLAAVIATTTPEGQPVVAVGHSMGGMSVLALVEQFPELAGQRLIGAVLLDTTGSDVVAGAAVTAGRAVLAGVRMGFVRTALGVAGRRSADRVYRASSDLSYLLTRAVGLNADASPAHVAFVEQLLLNCPANVRAALGPTLTSLDLRDAVPLLHVPVLVVVGAEDRLTPPGAARRLVEALPDARLVELPGIGHNAPLEAHEQVTRLISDFVQDVTSVREVG